ncbi:MAG: hypothetical protein IPM23_01965 [Candidatus Melainabacteria bacterium]|nr:hypothetical protein [Candidatus Melainabacteria bacterium]
MNRKEKEPVQKPAPSPLPMFTLDFGGSLGARSSGCRCSCQDSSGRKSGFDNTPRVPHDPFKMKPPEYPSLF